MQSTTICILACLVFLPVTPSVAQDDFKPATFHGLTIGKAKIADVKKQLGPPVDEYDDKDGTIWIYYEDIGPVPGRVGIPADKKTQLVWFVEITPKALSLDAAKEVFGPDYRLVHYA